MNLQGKETLVKEEGGGHTTKMSARFGGTQIMLGRWEKSYSMDSTTATSKRTLKPQ